MVSDDPTTPADYAAERCPNDPVGEGTHWFLDDRRCRYCGKLDMLLRADDPTAPRRRESFNSTTGDGLPGEPLPSGFDNYRPAPRDLLSPEARRRVDEKIESVRQARLRAQAEAGQSIVG